MKNLKGFPPEKGVEDFEGIDPSHEAYVYQEVPLEENVVPKFRPGCPPADAI